MYRGAYQSGLLSVLYSGGSNPLRIWEITKSKDGYINTFLDQDIKAMVIDIGGTNVSTTYLSCPPGKQVLGISLPFLVMIVKNLKKYFVFEITVLDDTDTRRRFRIANFQSTTQINPLCTVMPLHLSDGWNQIQFNLAEFTRRAYNKQYVELQKIRINANIRIRRIYCTARLLPEEELPPEYKLYFPLPSKKKAIGKENKQEQSNVGEKIESKLDVKVEKRNTGTGLQDNLAVVSAPSEGGTTEGTFVKQADAEGEPAEEAAKGVTPESRHSQETPAEAEGKPGDEIPAGGIEEGATAPDGELRAGELLAGESPTGEPLAEEPSAGEPSASESPAGEPVEVEGLTEKAPTESSEPEVTDGPPPSTE